MPLGLILPIVWQKLNIFIIIFFFDLFFSINIIQMFDVCRLEFEARNLKKEAKELAIIKQLEGQTDKIKLET